MSRQFQRAVGIVLIVASQLATANHEVKMLGQSSCTQWLQLSSNGKKKWLLGFLSGMNRGYAVNHKGHDPLEELASDKEAFDWMDRYCKANPQRDIADGGAALFMELKSR